MADQGDAFQLRSAQEIDLSPQVVYNRVQVRIKNKSENSIEYKNNEEFPLRITSTLGPLITINNEDDQ